MLRARIILLAAKGMANVEIARRVGCHVDTVRKWRSRFAQDSRVCALEDEKRGGRPPTIPLEARLEVVKLACDRPAEKGVEFRDVWTYAELAKYLEAQRGFTMSTSEIGRILRNKDFRPYLMRPWLHSPDPEFQPKVRRICDLYLDPPEDAHVICVDEKASMQALERKHATKMPAPGRAGRREFEYIRRGTQALIAGFDIKTGKVVARCGETRKADDLVAFMEHLAKQYPTGKVYIVWDNLNIHYDGRTQRWTEFNKRQGGRFVFVYTPLHASWVNQIEIWFSILARRVLRHGEFRSTHELRSTVLGFIRHWNRFEAHPFNWTFRGRFVQNERKRAA